MSRGISVHGDLGILRWVRRPGHTGSLAEGQQPRYVLRTNSFEIQERLLW